MKFPVVAIIVAILVKMALGAFWYSPKLFGTRWAKAYNFDINQLKPSIMNYLAAALVAAIMVLGIAALFDIFQIVNLGMALQFGFLAWLAYVATTHFSGVIWTKKPLVGYLIEVSFMLVASLLISAILVLL
jgi:sterol desaturase/sphingolipid hydroxylase (fatty acid hydroxylase superfamily)